MDEKEEALRQILVDHGYGERESYDFIWALREVIEAVITEKTGAV